jgi:hypothetical protein
MILGNSLLGANIAKHVQLLLVFPVHAVFLSGCLVETRESSDEGISLVFCTWLGYRLRRQVIRRYGGGGARGAAPPTSLALMPYGPHCPMNPGTFFQPLSALMVVGILGALISGRKTRPGFRIWLWLPVISFLILWAFTPTVFWPMIHEL